MKEYDILILRLVIGLFETNCYILALHGKNAAVIDPAGDCEIILNALKENGLTLKVILLTHGHRDHTDACAELASETGAEVYIHPDDYEMISEYNKSFPRGYFPGGFKPVKNYTPVNGGDIIYLDGAEIKTLYVPGHTMGGICYIVGNSLFSGDTLFAGTIGNTGFKTGNHALMMESLEKLKKLDCNYRILPGHGEETTLDYEKTHNPYLMN